MSTSFIVTSTRQYLNFPEEPQKDFNKEEKQPQEVRFVSADGRVRSYYLKNNPYKFSSQYIVDGTIAKVFRYCVVCGVERINENNSKRRCMESVSPAVCSNDQCQKELSSISAFVERSMFFNMTLQDQRRFDGDTNYVPPEGWLTDVGRVNLCAPCTQIVILYPHLAHQVPLEHVKIFDEIECLPIESRPSKIKNHMLIYAKEHDISPEMAFEKTDDPFLQFMQEYQKCCVEWLNKHRY